MSFPNVIEAADRAQLGWFEEYLLHRPAYESRFTEYKPSPILSARQGSAKPLEDLQDRVVPLPSPERKGSSPKIEPKVLDVLNTLQSLALEGFAHHSSPQDFSTSSSENSVVDAREDLEEAAIHLPPAQQAVVSAVPVNIAEEYEGNLAVSPEGPQPRISGEIPPKLAIAEVAAANRALKGPLVQFVSQAAWQSTNGTAATSSSTILSFMQKPGNESKQ